MRSNIQQRFNSFEENFLKKRQWNPPIWAREQFSSEIRGWMSSQPYNEWLMNYQQRGHYNIPVLRWVTFELSAEGAWCQSPCVLISGLREEPLHAATCIFYKLLINRQNNIWTYLSISATYDSDWISDNKNLAGEACVKEKKKRFYEKMSDLWDSHLISKCDWNRPHKTTNCILFSFFKSSE